MKTTITLIRHGQTEWNRIGKIQGRSDIPLNTTGIAQAVEKAAILSPDFTRAIASPLSRAEDTLTILLKEMELSIPRSTDAAFAERDFGIYDGGNGIHFREVLAKEPLDDSYETNAQLEARVMGGLHKHAEQYKTDHLLIAAHSHVLKAALVAIAPQDFDYFAFQMQNLATVTLHFTHATQKWSIQDHETYSII